MAVRKKTTKTTHQLKLSFPELTAAFVPGKECVTIDVLTEYADGNSHVEPLADFGRCLLLTWTETTEEADHEEV